jgi:glycerol-3-phosphate dehydrogenase (NAD(P)+)
MPKAAIIGSASWGTALGIVLARKGIRVKLWARAAETAEELNMARENTTFLPGFCFPSRLSATSSLEEALDKTDFVIFAVPAQSMRRNIREVKKYLRDSILIISATKGLEVGSSKRMSQIIAEEIDARFHNNICALSGPNIAQEAANGLHSVTVLASPDITVAERARQLINSEYFCAFTSTDIVGVELGGALKNVIALGAGIADGLDYGDNAKATLITRGLAEIIVLGTSVGANPLTFVGLTCLGDIVATCFSPFSRNHYVGIELAKGRSLKEIMNSMPHVAEGIATTLAARKLARRVGVDLPVTEQIYKVIYEKVEVNEAVANLMGHFAKEESVESSNFLRPLAHYIGKGWQRLPL